MTRVIYMGRVTLAVLRLFPLPWAPLLVLDLALEALEAHAANPSGLL